MNNTEKIKTASLFECEVGYLKEFFERYDFPWEMISRIGELADELSARGIEGFSEISKGVLVGKDVKISPLATIIAPAIIGDGCEIRPGAFLRGSVITGKGCVIGNSSELKNCILLDSVALPHYNYVGDSILGNRVHMGAGAICSNLKSDGSNVVIRGDGIEQETSLRKLGALIGDSVEIGCGCVLNPGAVIGKGSSVYPLSFIRGVIPDRCIVKNHPELFIAPRHNE